MDAFGDLYETYSQKIYTFLFYKTFDQATAEDLTAETFLKALKNKKSFQGVTGAEFTAWLYRIAYTTSVDYYRTHRESDEIEESSDALGYTPNIIGQIDAKTKIGEILTFLDTLPKEQKDIVIMRLWNDLSYEEIAQITGKSDESCRKIVSRVMAQIQANVSYVFALYLIQYYLHN